MGLTYKKAGVDIDKAAFFKTNIKSILRKSFSANVLKDIGGFGSFFEFKKNEFKNPVLVSSADGVGTKLKIAILANKHDSIGIDAVAMNVNDILCTGARPLFFLDYIAYSKLGQDTLYEIIKGINNGCIESGCSLIGGETAQMPGVYKDGEYDLAGFCVGAVEKTDIIDGSKIQAGDVLIGLESSGVHSNGYSLVRKVLSINQLKLMEKQLLIPTRIYVKPILNLLTSRGPKLKNKITGIAHITGGAFYDKLSRILPSNVNARIKRSSWVVPKIFKLIQNKGQIADKEMYRTFNMGIGMALVVRNGFALAVISRLKQSGFGSCVIGEIVKGRGEVEII